MDDLQTRQTEYLRELGTIPPSYEVWLDSLPTEQRKRVKSQVARIKTGLHAVAPITCFGIEKCPFARACPLSSHYPIGLQCPLENEYMVQKIADYITHLQVDPQNPVELSIVNELALVDLLKNRALLILSNGDSAGNGRDFLHVDETIMGFDEQGAPIRSTSTKLHPVATYMESLEKRRDRWLDKLMQTRKSQADWSLKAGAIRSDSKILDEIKYLRQHIDTRSLNE